MTNIERFKNGEVVIKTTIDDYLRIIYELRRANLWWSFGNDDINEAIPPYLFSTECYILYDAKFGIRKIDGFFAKNNLELLKGKNVITIKEFNGGT